MTRSQERRTPSEPSRNTIAMPTAPPHDGIRTWAIRFDLGGHSLARTVLRQHRSFASPGYLRRLEKAYLRSRRSP